MSTDGTTQMTAAVTAGTGGGFGLIPLMVIGVAVVWYAAASIPA